MSCMLTIRILLKLEHPVEALVVTSPAVAMLHPLHRESETINKIKTKATATLAHSTTPSLLNNNKIFLHFARFAWYYMCAVCILSRFSLCACCLRAKYSL